ncbi:MAG: hypothetical protein J0L97_00875 [Alphaproteobacteria bacterium]|nr:hypothetical protein [Alphaproteobacteria bacterium]
MLVGAIISSDNLDRLMRDPHFGAQARDLGINLAHISYGENAMYTAYREHVEAGKNPDSFNQQHYGHHHVLTTQGDDSPETREKLTQLLNRYSVPHAAICIDTAALNFNDNSLYAQVGIAAIISHNAELNGLQPDYTHKLQELTGYSHNNDHLHNALDAVSRGDIKEVVGEFTRSLAKNADKAMDAIFSAASNLRGR